jgi:hypothetical protein
MSLTVPSAHFSDSDTATNVTDHPAVGAARQHTRQHPPITSLHPDVQDIVYRARPIYIVRLMTQGPIFPTTREKYQLCDEAFLQARSELKLPSMSLPFQHRIDIDWIYLPTDTHRPSRTSLYFVCASVHISVTSCAGL